MSYTALYRKYRPTNFVNVVGQDVIVNVLKNSIKYKHISHAYLFAGPRGTGKTSIAKIFAHAVNCLNFEEDICATCDNCKFLESNDTDIIEIDAASNNGVEEIRTIRDNVKLLPSFCKYKIYIIDEVHMLSTGAFNALLKTLEEPPAHVIFVLATTEPNKIPVTIMSRCQRFDFNKISEDALFLRLKFILEQENKSLPDNVLEHIALLSDGGLRDAINLLDQTLSLSNENISIDDVDKLSGKISKSIIFEIIDYLVNSDYPKLLDLIEKLSLEGKDYNDIVNNLLIFIRDYSVNLSVKDYFPEEYSNSLSKYEFSSDTIINISKVLNELLIEMKNTNDQKVLFEIYIMHLAEIINTKFSTNNSCQHLSQQPDEIINSDNQKVLTESEEINVIDNEDYPKEENDNEGYNKIKKIRINNVLAGANKDVLNKINNCYDRVNDYISNKVYNSISALLIEAKVVVASTDYLLFTFKEESYVSVFDLNYKQIELFLNEVFDHKYKVVAITDNEWTEVRNEFILNKKNNIKYVFIDENDVSLEVSDSLDELENSALNIFGEDAISVK